MKKLLIGILMLGLMLSLTANAFAWQVTLAWDSNVELDLAGYRVYVSTTSKQYDLNEGYEVGVDANDNYTIPTEFPDGVTYYFVVTAFNEEGLESGFSNEVYSNGVSTGGMRPNAPGGCYIVTVE